MLAGRLPGSKTEDGPPANHHYNRSIDGVGLNELETAFVVLCLYVY